MSLEQQQPDNPARIERQTEAKRLASAVGRGLESTGFEIDDVRIFDNNGELRNLDIPDKTALIDLRYKHFLATEIYVDNPDFKGRIMPAMDELDFQMTQHMMYDLGSTYEDREIDLGYLEDLYARVLGRLREHAIETGEDLTEESNYLTEAYVRTMALRSEMAQEAVQDLMAEINTPKPNAEEIEDDGLAGN